MKTSIKFSLVLALALASSACVQRTPIGGNIVTIKATTAATGGDRPIEIRAFAFDNTKSGNTGEEIIGAACTVTSALYKQQVKTPVQAIVPLYGYTSPTVTVQCNAPGYSPGIKVVEAYNQTKSDMIQAGSGAGLLGLAVMGVAAGVSDARNHQFSYANIDVLMVKTP